eukprot:SAG25_NODE_689_length_5921_cov_14.049296_6_plen_76_part_00
MPPKLTRKIRGYFSVLYSQHGTVFDEMNFMSALPQNLREELVSCTFYLWCILYIYYILSSMMDAWIKSRLLCTTN